ncbi:hypothetical protein WBG78_08025 [Chryseolinea sp. T2]|uniref:hypothetical protein n=1 Tax=Chryseolinea sp. T2 TaxID=3129255 RepID=UPI003076E4D4
MKNVFAATALLLAIQLGCAHYMSAQIIGEVRHEPFYQKIIVNYDVQGLASNQRLEVALFCSDDGFKKSLTAVSGNGVGPDIAGNGEKTIVWDVLRDRKELVGNVSFTVKAILSEAPANSVGRTAVVAQTPEEKKAIVYHDFSTTMNDYINEGRNLVRAFSQAREQIFDDPATAKRVTESVYRYNNVYERLNTNRTSIEKQVLTLWGSEAHTAVQGIDDYALGDLHSVNVLALNEALMLVRDLGTGNINGRKNEKEARDKVLRTVEYNTSELDKRLIELQRRYARIATMLEK